MSNRRALAFGIVVALAAVVSRGAAQAPPAPPAPRADTTRPAALRPSAAPPPSSVAPAGPAPVAAAARPTAAPVVPVSRGSALPPDSVRPEVRAADPAPEGAAAQCADGALVADPAECVRRRGVTVKMPVASDPRSVAPSRATPVPPPAALRAATSQDATPPVGATQRCKDGTWLFGAPAANRCDVNGGTAVILAAPPEAPPPPRPRLP